MDGVISNIESHVPFCFFVTRPPKDQAQGKAGQGAKVGS